MTTIHNVNLNDYAEYTREEICEQIDDCLKAIQVLRKKKWNLEGKALEVTQKEIHNYEVEEMKLQYVLELIDTTGREY